MAGALDQDRGQGRPGGGGGRGCHPSTEPGCQPAAVGPVPGLLHHRLQPRRLLAAGGRRRRHTVHRDRRHQGGHVVRWRHAGRLLGVRVVRTDPHPPGRAHPRHGADVQPCGYRRGAGPLDRAHPCRDPEQRRPPAGQGVGDPRLRRSQVRHGRVHHGPGLQRCRGVRGVQRLRLCGGQPADAVLAGHDAERGERRLDVSASSSPARPVEASDRGPSPRSPSGA